MNPFLRLIEQPVASLTDLGWLLVLLAALAGTWWAAGRNLLWLDDNWRNGWYLLPDARYVGRLIALLGVLAADAWLLAAIVEIL